VLEETRATGDVPDETARSIDLAEAIDAEITRIAQEKVSAPGAFDDVDAAHDGGSKGAEDEGKVEV
jgi:shikimate kinase